MIFALTAALGWGVADFLGALSTRRNGVTSTILLVQVAGLAVLGCLALGSPPHHPPVPDRDLVMLAVGGVLGAAAFFGFYRALQLGPVALVSPIFAAYSAVTVILAFVVTGEVLSSTALGGVTVTIAGVVMASMTGSPEPGVVGGRRGIPFAIAAMIGWGVASYITGRYAQRLGWYYPVMVTRVVEVVVVGLVGLVLAGLGRDRGRPGEPLRWRYGVPLLAGVFDIVALLAFSRGSQLGLVSIVSAASASFPLIVVAGGIVVFHERPRPIQWVGVACTIGGLILLGLGS